MVVSLIQCRKGNIDMYVVSSMMHMSRNCEFVRRQLVLLSLCVFVPQDGVFEQARTIGEWAVAVSRRAVVGFSDCSPCPSAVFPLTSMFALWSSIDRVVPVGNKIASTVHEAGFSSGKSLLCVEGFITRHE